MSIQWRHEFKHQINYSDYLALKQRLSLTCQHDNHASGGGYLIRSLYFDTWDDSALYDKLNSVSVREKFRIRCYNNDFSLIKLEKKSKHNALSNKCKTLISADDVRRLIKGENKFLLERDDELCKELYAKIQFSGLTPVVVVDYYREPFTYAAGNVRVTLDRDIRSVAVKDFFSSNPASLPISQAGMAVLEVKYDAFLPDMIRDIVQVNNRKTGAFSKYAACRLPIF